MSAVRLASKKPASAAVIIFHGLGDSGQGWKFFGDLARESPDFDDVNFIFPNAPSIPVTVNGGRQIPAWFDIKKFGASPEEQDKLGYSKALNIVEKYIDEQINNGIKPERIIVGGFSQGGGLALGTLVKSKRKLGGIVALSPAVRFYETLTALKKSDINIDTPVFHGHGDVDAMISKPVSDINANFFINDLGYKNYTYTVYPGLGHTSNKEELDFSLNFIKNILKN